MPVTARAVAICVLERVAEQGAYASRALDAELSRAHLDARDAGLATEIVYGTLRVLPALDGRIASFLKRDARTLDGLVRAALRAGCYQLDHLDRSPAHAIVNDSVNIVRAERGRELSGFVNAVLRKVADSAEAARLRAPRTLLVPAWMHAALGVALGAERREALLSGASSSPPLALRLRADVEREAFAERLRQVRPLADVQLGRVSPRAVLARRVGNPRTLPGYAEGEFAVQEEGAQTIALACGAQPGEVVADLCAGHGGKTALLAEAVGAHGEVTAIDLDPRKLERIPAELNRLGLSERKLSATPSTLQSAPAACPRASTACSSTRRAPGSARFSAGPSCCCARNPRMPRALPAYSSRSCATPRACCVPAACWSTPCARRCWPKAPNSRVASRPSYHNSNATSARDSAARRTCYPMPTAYCGSVRGCRG